MRSHATLQTKRQQREWRAVRPFTTTGTTAHRVFHRRNRKDAGHRPHHIVALGQARPALPQPGNAAAPVHDEGNRSLSRWDHLKTAMNPEKELNELLEIVETARTHPTKDYLTPEVVAALVVARAINTLSRVIETRPLTPNQGHANASK